MRTKRLGLIGVAALAVVAFAPTMLAADQTVTVRPSTLHGWIIDETVLGNPPIPSGISTPADSAGGSASLHFGPIVNGSGGRFEKYEAQPPEVNVLAEDFESFAYEFKVIAPPAAGSAAVQFYANVYVDNASNGLGVFSNGFYDCRMSFIPSSSAAPWNTFSFTDTTAPSATGGASCAANIGSFDSGSLIRFFRINGGDTGSSLSDTGLEGAFDFVSVKIDGSTTTYDFELDIDQPASKDDCKKNGWQDFAKPGNVPFKNQGDCIQYINTGK